MVPGTGCPGDAGDSLALWPLNAGTWTPGMDKAFAEF